MFWLKRNWEKIKVGDKIKAKKNVPALMEHAIQFNKNEIVQIAEVQDTYIGVKDKFNDISYFAKKPHNGTDFIGNWFN